MTREAQLEEGPSGLTPTDDGWFVVNVRDTAWVTHHAFGSGRSKREYASRGSGVSASALAPYFSASSDFG